MPYTGIVLAILAVHAAAFLILISHWLVALGLFPKAIQKLADQYESRSTRATILGLFTYGPLIVLLLNAKKLGPAAPVALVSGVLAILVAFIGTAGLALRIGRNLSPGAEPWSQSLRGGIMLALVFITPFLGWLFVLHIGLASGFGAVLLTKPWKRKTVPPALESPVPAPAPEPAPVIAESAEPVLS